MKESIKSIIEWNEQTFGEGATFEGQMQKFRDEREEWEASDRTDITELADMAIVAAGISRFSFTDSIFALSAVWQEYCRSEFTSEALERAIDKKMAKNRARKWTAQNGSFQHVVE